MSKKRANQPTLSALQEKIRVLMNDRLDDMATGSCQDFAAYKHSTGVIEGLALAERELLDLDIQIDEA